MKYIDAERLRAEIKNSINEIVMDALDHDAGIEKVVSAKYRKDALTDVLSIIDSLHMPAEWSEDIIRKAVKEIGLTQYQINWFKTNVFPPKPSWNEEDEKNLELVVDCIYEFYPDPVMKYKLKDWLKSFRSQPQGVYKQIVHSIYKMLKGKDFYGMPTGNCISLLNDIRVKCKDADECAEILDEPSWKPSEEHLSALLAVFNDPDNIGSQSCQLALTDLYEQLKKL